jgi:hypothetical protein
MKASREILERQLEEHEEKLRGLHSYVKELSDTTAKLGTEREQFEEDLMEAQQNIKYYESEIARLKHEVGGLPKAGRPQTGADAILPQTVKQGIGSLIISSISFVAGALIGSKLKSRRGSEDKEEKR